MRCFGLGTSGYPGFHFPHLNVYRISHFLVPETTLHCTQRSFFLACLANRYLLAKITSKRIEARKKVQYEVL